MEKLLDDKIVELLNYRGQQEEYSARLYAQMSLWLDNKGYKHLSALYKEYAQEEREHAHWAREFLLNHGITPELKSLASPYTEYGSCMEVLEATLEHELDIQKQCEEMAEKALELKNAALRSLALKYCEEQVDEIGKAIDIIDHAKLTSDMLVLDHYVERYLEE